MKIQILSRFDLSVIFEHEADVNSIKITVMEAIKAKVSLICADLRDANFSDADLRGANFSGADLSGANFRGETLTKAPIQLNNLYWTVLITDKYLKIGCERHTFDKWKSFTDAEISDMDFKALDFSNKWKSAILALCDAHRAD